MGELNIMFWNCNGITNRTEELQAFIKNHNIHIIFLGETRLSPNKKFSIPNFHAYSSDRTPKPILPNGDTAVLIHRKIIHQHIHIST